MSNLHLRAILRQCPLLAGLFCLASFSPLPAQTTVGAGQAVKQAIKLDEIASLKMAKQLLEGANHDYKGHRAKAVHAIHQAIAEIEHHHHKGTGKQAPTSPAAAAAKANAKALHSQAAAKTPIVHEAQAASDTQLRAAEQLLVKVQSELATGKHPKAIAHVQLALQELQVALAIK